MLHYYAKKFFAPVLVSVYVEGLDVSIGKYSFYLIHTVYYLVFLGEQAHILAPFAVHHLISNFYLASQFPSSINIKTLMII